MRFTVCNEMFQVTPFEEVRRIVFHCLTAMEDGDG